MQQLLRNIFSLTHTVHQCHFYIALEIKYSSAEYFRIYTSVIQFNNLMLDIKCTNLNTWAIRKPSFGDKANLITYSGGSDKFSDKYI